MKTKHFNQTKMGVMSLLMILLIVFFVIPMTSNAQTWTGTTVPTQTNAPIILLNPTYSAGTLSRNSFIGFSANSQTRWTIGTDYAQNGTNDLYFSGGTPSGLKFYMSKDGAAAITSNILGGQTGLKVNVVGGNKDDGYPDIFRGSLYGTDRFVVNGIGYIGIGVGIPYVSAQLTMLAENIGTNQFAMGSFIEARIGSATNYKTPFKVDYNGTVIADKAIIGDGTTNYPLAVNGGIMTTKVRVAMPNSSSWSWPDYVFSKNYELKSLHEVESYINANNHLPNVPSAEEVGKSGLELAEMNAKLLEKIEELTLYLIQQQKQIDALNAKVK